MKKGKIFKTSYHIQNDELIFDIYGRDLDRESFHLQVHNTEPYFFVEDEPSPAEFPQYARLDGTAKTMDGKILHKIVTEKPWQVGKLRNKFEPHYEADIQYNNRMRYDYGWQNYITFPGQSHIYSPEKIKPAEVDEKIPYRKCVYDLEDIGGTTIKKSKEGRGKIGSIAFYDSWSKKYGIIVLGKYNLDRHKTILQRKMDEADVEFDIDLDEIKIITVPTEEHVLKKFKSYLDKTKPDIMVGWNNPEYDRPVLENRADKGFSMDFNLSKYGEYDMLVADERLTYHTVRNKLEIRASRLLGVGKIKDKRDVKQLYEEDRAKFIAYNLWDVILTEKIDKYHDGTRIHEKLSSKAGTNIGNCKYQSKIADPFVFYKAFEYTEKGLFDERPIFPSTKFAKKKESKFVGAYVGSPSLGRYEVVAVLDFKSEYPMVMWEFNISPETFAQNPDPEKEYYISPNGNYYRKKPVGFIPRIMRDLLQERNEVKERMKEAKASDDNHLYKQLYAEQRSIKILMNSFYGLFGSGGGTFRLANQDMSEDVTAWAREHVKFTKKIVEGRNGK